MDQKRLRLLVALSLLGRLLGAVCVGVLAQSLGVALASALVATLAGAILPALGGALLGAIDGVRKVKDGYRVQRTTPPPDLSNRPR